MADHEDYRTWHVGENHGAKYDVELFAKNSFGLEIWKKEKKILIGIIEKYASDRQKYLDFACGTGRILQLLEQKFDQALGLDISQDMLQQAQSKLQKAQLVCGDATENPHIIPDDFDCITSFRFFLNAQPRLRHQVLDLIAKKLKHKNSIFVFNIHGNRYSTRWFLVMFDRLFNRSYQHQMSLREVKMMLEPHGLEIIEYYGVGYIYKVFFKFLPRGLWLWLETLFEKINWLKPFSVYFIFVCRLKK